MQMLTLCDACISNLPPLPRVFCSSLTGLCDLKRTSHEVSSKMAPRRLGTLRSGMEGHKFFVLGGIRPPEQDGRGLPRLRYFPLATRTCRQRTMTAGCDGGAVPLPTPWGTADGAGLVRHTPGARISRNKRADSGEEGGTASRIDGRWDGRAGGNRARASGPRRRCCAKAMVCTETPGDHDQARASSSNDGVHRRVLDHLTCVCVCRSAATLASKPCKPSLGMSDKR